MCIALLTTAHPEYALILINNRDEFILRPTSRPHWWDPPPPAHSRAPASTAAPAPPPAPVLSSRDLLRAERGTWLGVSRDGILAVLTNYRETIPVHGARSRGGMVLDWLSGHDYGLDRRAGGEEQTPDAVRRFVGEEGLGQCGGFSMVCGRLKLKRSERAIEPLAVISNRLAVKDGIPLVVGQRNECFGLSNTSYDDPDRWPKIRKGKDLLDSAIGEAVADRLPQDKLVEKLLSVLDTDTLPRSETASFGDVIMTLKQSIFIPALGDEAHRAAMGEAARTGSESWDVEGRHRRDDEEGHDVGNGFETGMYGTQRQTAVLVGWDGEVTYVERALWDANGRKIERGQGDTVTRFKIEGWEDGGE